jgi:hypothetical protein
MLYRSKISRTGRKRGILFTAVVLGLAQAALTATPTTTVRPLILSGRQSTRPAGTYSAGVAEIIKMLDAKVDGQVILAYIQNSPIPYNPEVTELIALKDHGASTETLVALLHHGDELRLKMAQAQSAANPAPVAPAYDYPPAAANPPYPYGYDDSSYAPYPAASYSYGYGWPVAYWPYWYAHGRYYPHSGYGYHAGGSSAHRNWASAARPTPYAPQSVAAPSRGHTGSPVVHSGGWRDSGHSGGRSGGRSR